MSSFIKNKLYSDDDLIGKVESLADSYFNRKASERTHAGLPVPLISLPPTDDAFGYLNMTQLDFNFCSEFEKIANPHALMGRSERVHEVINAIKDRFKDVAIDAFVYRAGRLPKSVVEPRW